MHEILRITASETEQFLQEKYGSGIADVKQIGEGGWSLAFAFVHVRLLLFWIGDHRFMGIHSMMSPGLHFMSPGIHIFKMFGYHNDY
jgi:hypothetical protein